MPERLNSRSSFTAGEARVIHCSEQHGLCCEGVLALRQTDWKKLTFYEPIVGCENP